MLCLTLYKGSIVVIGHEQAFTLQAFTRDTITFQYRRRIYDLPVKCGIAIEKNVFVEYIRRNAKGVLLGFTAPRDIAINRLKIERAIMERSRARRDNTKPIQ